MAMLAMLETISRIAECSTYLIAAGYLGFALCQPLFNRKTFELKQSKPTALAARRRSANNENSGRYDGAGLSG
jgi:hypothetical protein